MLRHYIRIGYQTIGKEIKSLGPSSGGSYLRPGGEFYYKLPGGVDYYLRP